MVLNTNPEHNHITDIEAKVVLDDKRQDLKKKRMPCQD